MHQCRNNLIAIVLLLIGALGLAAEAAPPAARLKVAVVQMALAPTLEANRDRIRAGIERAAARGARVAVFPEGALRGSDGNNTNLVEACVAAIAQSARDHKLYVVLGGDTFSPAANKEANWMRVLDPEGREIFRYEKLYDHHRAAMPGVFPIDGIPCSAIICADRWLRGVAELPIQQGAQVSFELSCNFASEWVAPFEWYWYVPRALRNNVWVIFANSGNQVAGQADDPAAPHELRHGHSAIIAPDGHLTATARDDRVTIVFAELDLAAATRAEAQARAAHPVLREFWDAGLKLQRGEVVAAPALAPVRFQATSVTLAIGQSTNVAQMEALVRQARERKADLLVFPERAAPESALLRLQTAARENRIAIVAGMEHHAGAHRFNSAYVIGTEGQILTRYDQFSATHPFQAGTNAAAMWFAIKGVPAVVTIGRDALWTELSELAAVAGARIHVHLDHDADTSRAAGTLRLQRGVNLASFLMFTVVANTADSMIWDDLGGLEESRAEVRDLPRPDPGPVLVYSPFSANLVARAQPNETLLVVTTRRITGPNPHYPQRTISFNPQMDAWYRLGAALIKPK